jgi:hypothetical protein
MKKTQTAADWRINRLMRDVGTVRRPVTAFFNLTGGMNLRQQFNRRQQISSIELTLQLR